jgi:hypothetical protein
VHDAGFDALDAGLLEDAHPARFDHVGQPAHEFRRLDRGAVRRVRRAEYVGGREPRAGLRRVEQFQVETELVRLGSLVTRALQLGLAAREDDRPAWCDVGVDVLRPGDP